jgi:hypothetical protein
MWPLRVRVRRYTHLRDESGSMIMEVVVAAFILAVAIMAISSSLSGSLGLVGNSRQRSGAVAVAQERLERVHNIPYDRVALYCGCLGNSTPTHSNDDTNPDNALSNDGTQYTVDPSHTEPVIFDAAAGGIKHIDDPVTVGQTQFNIYQYVSWYDDPHVTGTQNYKRVVVVVTWKFPVASGQTNRVFQSTLIGDGTVSVPSAAPSTASPTSGPASATPAVTSCPGDTAAPTGTVSVLSGAGAVQGYTNSTNVQIVVNATDTCAPIAVRIKNGSGDQTNLGAYTAVTTVSSGVSATLTWTIPSGSGTKDIITRFSDAAGNTSNPVPKTITLDQAVPTLPGSVRATSCTLGGNSRSLTLTWNASTDAEGNLVGYRVYKSINQGTFSLLAATASQSASDTDSKSYNSVTYRVTAYDKAGNESGAPNDISFAKNSC